jgi:FkbM family methyltransferase
LDTELGDAELAGVFTGCHAYVQPYRGEGFGLPILEAMACGLPVIATAGGSSDDFVSDDLGYRIPSRRVDIQQADAAGLDLCGRGWWLEPDFDSLVDLLRHVHSSRAEADAKGRRAASVARVKWSWHATAMRVEERVGVLGAPQSESRRAGASRRHTPTQLRTGLAFVRILSAKGPTILTRSGTWDAEIVREVVDADFYGLRSWSPCRPPRFIVDVGAHIGAFSMWAASRHTNTQVLAFECEPGNAEIARRNLTRFSNVVLVEAALGGDKPATGILPPLESPLNTGGFRVQYEELPDGTGSGKPPRTMTLAEVFRKYRIDRIDFLKLDCEGSEWHILTDVPSELLRRIDVVSMELHCRYPQRESVGRMKSLLKPYFRSIKVQQTEDQTLCRIYASLPISGCRRL